MPPVGPAERAREDAAWRALLGRLPASPPPVSRPQHRQWLVAAAGFLLGTLLAVSVWVLYGYSKYPSSPALKPIMPVVVADAPILDLYSGADVHQTIKPGIETPAQLPSSDPVTLRLHVSESPGAILDSRIVAGNDHEIWSGGLHVRTGGVCSVALSPEALRQRPLTIVLSKEKKSIASYWLP